MPRQILGHAVHHEIRAEIQGLLETGRREGVVDDDERAPCVRQPGDPCDVIDEEPRVGRRLEPHHPRPAGQGALHGVGIGEIDLGNLAAARLEHRVQHPERAAIDVVWDEDALTRQQVRLQDRVFGRQSRSEHGRVRRALEIREHRFETRARRVRRARVVEAAVLARSDLLVRGRLENGRDHRAGVRFGRLSGVNGACGKVHG